MLEATMFAFPGLTSVQIDLESRIICGGRVHARKSAWTTIGGISKLGEDGSLADDLNLELGIVSSGVALLLRPAEI